MPDTTEDTMIEARPKSAGWLFVDRTTESDLSDNSSVFERCRAVFRQLGERLSSFDLSRQIYG